MYFITGIIISNSSKRAQQFQELPLFIGINVCNKSTNIISLLLVEESALIINFKKKKISNMVVISRYMFLVLVSFYLCICRAYDVNWLPAEADGPLPLSEKYRSSLRELCQRLADTRTKKSRAFAAEIESKKPSVLTMCRRLAEDDLSSGSSSNTKFPKVGQLSNKIGIIVSCALIIAVLVYYLRLDEPLKKLWFSFIGQGRYTAPVQVHEGKVSKQSRGEAFPSDIDAAAQTEPETQNMIRVSSGSRNGSSGNELSIQELRELRLRRLQTKSDTSSSVAAASK